MSDLKSNFVKLRTTRGWLFDVYPRDSNEVTVWVIAENGERVKLADRFACPIYISGDFADLNVLASKIKWSQSVDGLRFVEKHADFMDASKRKVLEVNLSDHRESLSLARKVFKFGRLERFRLFNVDIPVAQAYLYEKNVFPFAHVLAIDCGDKLAYDVLDSAERVDYEFPYIRQMWFDVEIYKEKTVPQFTDRIKQISIESEREAFIFDCESEADKLLEFAKAVERLDPDLIMTHGGDSFLLPYLAHRAFVHGISEKFTLSREKIPLTAGKGASRSYFSYGRIYHKSALRRLYGRVHIDVDNTFIYTACGLEGLIELARTCRVPLHPASRASIGSIMSSLQLYTALRQDVLIPWKKSEPESFKSGQELIVADRGGFIFEPRLGFHIGVVEVDFTSMFPMLMLNHNISAETVLCKCCPDSKTRVPELGYNICEKKVGIVPMTLDLLLRKRLKYKNLAREIDKEQFRHAYRMRQGALKWILVTCFGYLGYRNARFGKVDAHIAVCAFARKYLLQAARIAEEAGFEVVHGIVDSLWLKKKDASSREVSELCRAVFETTGVPLSVEGKYRWIVFAPSKILSDVPVLSRYYGVFENGNIKMRGVEARRGDTPKFVCEAQTDMIKKLAFASDVEEFRAKIPEALNVLRVYVRRLVDEEVDVRDLLVTKRLSKKPSRYTHKVLQAIAAKQLEQAGFEVNAGQKVSYVVANTKCRNTKDRVAVSQLLTESTKYDVHAYEDMLFEAAESLFGFLGYTKDAIKNQVLRRERQAMLQ